MPRDPRYDPLFEPIAIGPKTLKNRFYQVPQCTGAGVLKPGANAAHREVKAEGGWGALCTESCSIHPEVNQTLSTCTTLWDEGDVINHRHMTDEVHKWGALAGVELGAGGVKDNLQTRYVAAAFDRFPSAGIPKVYTYEADEDDIRRIMRMYEEAAQRAIDAGFDILYVHGAAGVFPMHALSRHFNRRTDGYGGSFENRARFWVEALETLRRVADGQCAVATRIGIDDLTGSWGLELHDEGLRFVELATREGLVDLWDVIIGGAGEDHWGEDSGPSRFYKSNHQAPWNSEVKRIAKAPVVGVGRFTDPDEMVRVIRGLASSTSSAAPDPPSRIPGCRARSTRGVPRTSASASAAMSACRASTSATPSSAPRTRRRWRSIAAAGIPSASRQPRSPARCWWWAAALRGWSAPVSWRCAAIGYSWPRPRRRWAAIFAT